EFHATRRAGVAGERIDPGCNSAEHLLGKLIDRLCGGGAELDEIAHRRRPRAAAEEAARCALTCAQGTLAPGSARRRLDSATSPLSCAVARVACAFRRLVEPVEATP